MGRAPVDPLGVGRQNVGDLPGVPSAGRLAGTARPGAPLGVLALGGRGPLLRCAALTDGQTRGADPRDPVGRLPAGGSGGAEPGSRSGGVAGPGRCGASLRGARERPAASSAPALPGAAPVSQDGAAESRSILTSTPAGRVISAMVPGPEESRSSTTMPCRAASRATTCRPMKRTSPTPARGSRNAALWTARRSAGMPTPSSTICTTACSPSRQTVTPTGDSGDEKRVALSRISARMCATSCTARAAMPTSASTTPSETRSKRSICWAAATMTVEQSTSSVRTRPCP